MSIRINNKTIAGASQPLSYRYVGEIFQSALPINDSRVALLDGHIITQDEGHGAFIQYISSLSLLYPQLICTEEEWQANVEKYGEWGQFVISDDTVRLPKIVSFVQGLNSLEDLASLMEAGLPNITGSLTTATHSLTGGAIKVNGSGALTVTTSSIGVGSFTVNSGSGYPYAYNIDASLSSIVYGNSNTVQPQSIRYPYYIVLATGVTQEIKTRQELTTNNPFTLLESKYSEIEIENTSWLLSNGQWNDGEVYQSAYEELVRKYNNGESGIALHIDSYTDYDFVIDLEQQLFRLPLLNGSESLSGNKYLDLTLGASGDTYTAPANGWIYLQKDNGGTNNYCQLKNETTQISGWAVRASSTVNNGCFLPVKKGDVYSVIYNAMGETQYFRFIYAQGSGSLYYYVGETNENVSLVSLGKLTNALTKKMERKGNQTVVDSYKSGTSWYRIWSDGWCEQGGYYTMTATAAAYITITLLQPFIDTTYSILTTADKGTNNNDSGSRYLAHLNGAKTTSTFIVRIDQKAYTVGFVWEARGYIK